jgi:hypothetical protein
MSKRLFVKLFAGNSPCELFSEIVCDWTPVYIDRQSELFTHEDAMVGTKKMYEEKFLNLRHYSSLVTPDNPFDDLVIEYRQCSCLV